MNNKTIKACTILHFFLGTHVIRIIMPRKSKLKLPPINLGDETFGQRLARLRKEKGYTQAELASKMGLVQALVSEYERDRIRLHHEMVARFALALEVSADVLLGLNATKKKHKSPSLRLQKRMIQIDALPAHQQKILLRTIDTILKAVQQ